MRDELLPSNVWRRDSGIETGWGKRIVIPNKYRGTFANCMGWLISCSESGYSVAIKIKKCLTKKIRRNPGRNASSSSILSNSVLIMPMSSPVQSCCSKRSPLCIILSNVKTPFQYLEALQQTSASACDVAFIPVLPSW